MIETGFEKVFSISRHRVCRKGNCGYGPEVIPLAQKMQQIRPCSLTAEIDVEEKDVKLVLLDGIESVIDAGYHDDIERTLQQVLQQELRFRVVLDG